MVSSLRLFILGSFRDLDGSASRALGVVERLAASLRLRGWDAFISGDPRSRELAGGTFLPRAMTEILEPLSDLALYVATLEGRGDGWVSELTAMQIKHPGGAPKRVLLLEAGYPLTSILDPAQQGYLSAPPVRILVWRQEADLATFGHSLAFRMARYGHLPPLWE